MLFFPFRMPFSRSDPGEPPHQVRPAGVLRPFERKTHHEVRNDPCIVHAGILEDRVIAFESDAGDLGEASTVVAPREDGFVQGLTQ